MDVKFDLKIEIEDLIKKYFENFNLDDYDDFGEFEFYLNKKINKWEFDSYSDAMEYLHKNDLTLKKSFEISSKKGFDVDDLDSIVLASLLKREEIKKYFEANELFKMAEKYYSL